MHDTHRQDLVRTLVIDPDPVRRSQAHAELAHRAMADANLEKAALHYAEAVELDPTDEVSREALDRIQGTSAPSGGRFGRWLRGFRRA